MRLSVAHVRRSVAIGKIVNLRKVDKSGNTPSRNMKAAVAVPTLRHWSAPIPNASKPCCNRLKGSALLRQ